MDRREEERQERRFSKLWILLILVALFPPILDDYSESITIQSYGVTYLSSCFSTMYPPSPAAASRLKRAPYSLVLLLVLTTSSLVYCLPSPSQTTSVSKQDQSLNTLITSLSAAGSPTNLQDLSSLDFERLSPKEDATNPAPAWARNAGVGARMGNYDIVEKRTVHHTSNAWSPSECKCQFKKL